MGHDYVGTEHLLLALYRDPNGLGAEILVQLGLSEDEAVEAVSQLVKPGGRLLTTKLPFRRKANSAIEAARAAANDLAHGYVGTEHLLIVARPC